jgi:hypothetical protein
MVPIVPEPFPDLKGVPVLAVSARYDLIVPADEALKLFIPASNLASILVDMRPGSWLGAFSCVPIRK